MFEAFKFGSTPKSEKETEVILNYAEIAKNKKKIDERKLREKTSEEIKALGKEIEIQQGVEKAREVLEREFEHKS